MNWKKLFVKFIDNWPAKVLSLLLAIILFIFHRMSTLETRFFSRPIVLEHLNAMTPSGSYPRMIRVSIRGEAGSIYSILEEDIEIYVDMEKFETPGAYSVPVLWRKKGTALGVAPLQISVDPVEITFSLDRRISKFVPITASFRGQLEAGFNMTSFSINPAQVIIEGPAEIISGVFELYTENVDLDGRTSDFSTTVNILRRDPMVMIRGDGTTEFSGNISQVIPVRNISNVPIAVTGLREGFTAELEIKAGSIHLEADNLEAVNIFNPPPDFLKVDCSGISEPGVYNLRILTGDIENFILEIDPEEVKVHINREEDRRH